MSRRRQPVVKNPHHLISEVDDALVKRLSIQRNLRQVAVMSPDVTLDEIKELCREDHGPGKYRIVALDHDGKQCKGYRGFQIREKERPLIGDFSGPKAHSTDFWSQQAQVLQTQQQSVEDARAKLDEDRERYMGEILDVKNQANNQQTSIMQEFMTMQAGLQAQLEERRMELDAAAREREAEREARAEAELAKLEMKRLDIEAKMSEIAERKHELEIHYNEKLFELKFAQMEEASERQRELDRKALELERKKMELASKERERELDKKYGLSAEAGVPQEVL